MSPRTGIVRRFAERVAGPIVVRRRLPPISGGGTIYASGRVGGLKYLFKRSDVLDPELLDAAQVLVRPGAVVWDVGANVGLFSRAAAFHAGSRGRVIAFEPDIDAIGLLNRTEKARASTDAPIVVVQTAVSDTDGSVQFAIARRSRAANAIAGFGSTQTGGVAQIRTVPCSSMDALLARYDAPWVVKIDVEGAELRVLQGGQRLLSDVRPWIHCEVAAENARQVAELLTEHGYRFAEASAWTEHGMSDRVLDEAPFNTIAVPQEQLGELPGAQRLR